MVTHGVDLQLEGSTGPISPALCLPDIYTLTKPSNLECQLGTQPEAAGYIVNSEIEGQVDH